MIFVHGNLKGICERVFHICSPIKGEMKGAPFDIISFFHCSDIIIIIIIIIIIVVGCPLLRPVFWFARPILSTQNHVDHSLLRSTC